MLPFLVLGGLVGITALASKSPPRQGVMTPQREIIYEAALTAEKDPNRLRTLANAFRSEGLTLQADLLDKRADLRLVPPHIQKMRKQIIKDTLSSSDPEAVSAMAGEFDAIGASGTAHAMRQHALGLRARQAQE